MSAQVYTTKRNDTTSTLEAIMSERSAFEKIHVPESETADLGGVLEQLNLPPAVVTFVRENKRLVQGCIAAVAIIIVAWALYDSHRDKKIEEGASALSVALDIENTQEKIAELTSVSSQYSGTSSALWAKINTAHEMMKTDQKSDALALYEELLGEIDTSSPLYPLVSISLAQGYEIGGDDARAAAEYEKIKLTDGYQGLGYLGLARISEKKGDKQKALEIYEQYLGTLMNVTERNEKGLVEEKIARLKAIL